MVDADTRAAVAAEFVRLVLDSRLVAVLLTLVWLRVEGTTAIPLAVAVPTMVVGVVSFAALKRWTAIGRWVAAHPGVLAADLVLGVLVLTLVGVDSPFVYVLVGTALMAGVLYGYVGAAVFGVLLVASHAIVALRTGPATFTTLVTVPVLYPAATFAAAAVGRLFVERSSAVQLAAGIEARTAVARDLHDTLAKTVQGLRFRATALEAAARTGQVDRVREHAGALRDAAAAADREARWLMRGWRDVPARTADCLATLLAATVETCATEGGPVVELDCPGTLPALGGEREHDLDLVVREAVRNAVRHADATRVRVSAAHDPGAGTVRITVADDGVGWPPPDELQASEAAGHYGIVGIRERVRRQGGGVELDDGPLGGAAVIVDVPVTTAGRQTGVAV